MRWRALLKLLAVLLLMAGAVGSACAFFLWSLDLVTHLRFAQPWLLFTLPVIGFSVGWIYHRWGRSVEGGSNLLLDQIHKPGGGVPWQMAPLVLLGTLATHLGGGSAGREGTAVQMGGSLASAFACWFRLEPAHVRVLLMAGIAAGFGAVFGTPWAGAVFAVEVLTIGRLEWSALPVCLLAAVAGDWSCQAWGITHTTDQLRGASSGFSPISCALLARVILAAIVFGLASRLFAESSHFLSGWCKRLIAYPPLRPAAGGLLVIGLFFLAGTSDYLGLGVTSPDPHAITIVSFFESSAIHPWSWLWKMIFTVVTLSSGFKGGEVTPLFFIGAALGNALAGLLGAPPELFAALGFVALFAGATHAPLACTLMGIELFGTQYAIYLLVACLVAYGCSGHTGIYLSQRIRRHKLRRTVLPPGTTLRSLRAPRQEPPSQP